MVNFIKRFLGCPGFKSHDWRLMDFIRGYDSSEDHTAQVMCKNCKLMKNKKVINKACAEILYKKWEDE